MMIGVAETLVAHGEIVEEPLCVAFAANYDPARCYGPGARRILEAMRDGEDWHTLADTIFPGGSLGNGGAMRVAPVGLLFGDDLGRVMEQAERSALPTHRHPLGVEGTQLMALAVALAARQPTFDGSKFYRELIARARSEEFVWQLKAASKLNATLFPRLSRQQSRGAPLRDRGHRLLHHGSQLLRIGDRQGDWTRRRYRHTRRDDRRTCRGTSRNRSDPDPPPRRLEEQDKGRSYIENVARRLHDRYQIA